MIYKVYGIYTIRGNPMTGANCQLGGNFRSMKKAIEHIQLYRGHSAYGAFAVTEQLRVHSIVIGVTAFTRGGVAVKSTSLIHPLPDPIRDQQARKRYWEDFPVE